MIVAWLAVACAAPPPPPEVPVADPTSVRSTASDVFVGRVVEVGPPPAVWSGLVAVTQRVTWSVEATRVGTASGTVVLEHPVVANSPTADRSRPGLDPTLFAVGARRVVYATRVNGVLRPVSEASVVAEE